MKSHTDTTARKPFALVNFPRIACIASSLHRARLRVPSSPRYPPRLTSCITLGRLSARSTHRAHRTAPNAQRCLELQALRD